MLLRISLIFAILAGIGTIVLTHLKTREHIQTIITARNNFEQEKNKQTSRANKAEADLAKTRDTLNTTSNTLVKTEEELNGTKQQLAAANDSLTKTRAELARTIEARKNLEGELSKWSQLGVTPEQVRDVMTNLKKSQDAIAALEDEKSILSRRVARLENDLRRIVGDDYEVPLPAGTKGTVVAVDPKWNFVVLDIGENKSILPGGVLMVHRNSKLVGKVQITQVMPNRSIANLMPGWRLSDIEEGDQVIYKE
jgi:myosin heavy subunit